MQSLELPCDSPPHAATKNATPRQVVTDGRPVTEAFQSTRFEPRAPLRSPPPGRRAPRLSAYTEETCSPLHAASTTARRFASPKGEVARK